jgi:hypothetical protein
MGSITPALLISTSSPPKAARRRRPPPPPPSSGSRRRGWRARAARSRPQGARWPPRCATPAPRFAPASANSRAAASPIPRLAPVIRTVFPRAAMNATIAEVVMTAQGDGTVAIEMSDEVPLDFSAIGPENEVRILGPHRPERARPRRLRRAGRGLLRLFGPADDDHPLRGDGRRRADRPRRDDGDSAG